MSYSDRSGERVENPGQNLRNARERLGLTLRDIEEAASIIAARHGNQEFAVSLSRLSDLETKCMVPSIYRIYSLASIYRLDLREVLSWYGIEVDRKSADISQPDAYSNQLSISPKNSLQLRTDIDFDFGKTRNLGRLIQKWGVTPLAYLESFQDPKYTIAYLGEDDFTMYPTLLPGSFLQIDESRNQVSVGSWRSEYQRPIYFVEMRDGFACCWCSVDGDSITLQPHPLSCAPVRILRYPQQAEVVGQVVGIAMRLDGPRIDSRKAINPAIPK
jgi:transcriptional regulator with XRE-family HTH domain